MKYRPRNIEINLDYILSNCNQSPNECMEWNKTKNTKGYGVIRINHKNYLVHRFVYELIHGEVDRKLLICHKCDNPICCNPQHLFLGTYKDNTEDMLKKGRENKDSRNVGESHGRAKLTEQEVITIRKLSNNGQSLDSLSKKYGVSKMNISRIVRYKRWKHINLT